MPWIVLLLAVVLGLAAACGRLAGPGTGGPGEPTSTDLPPVSRTDAPLATPVEPHPGTVDPLPHAWERIEVGEDDRTLTVLYVGGTQDCYQLDRVEVRERPATVTVTVYEGLRPDLPPDAACIEIGVYKAATVVLTEPLGDRELLDGAPRG